MRPHGAEGEQVGTWDDIPCWHSADSLKRGQQWYWEHRQDKKTSNYWLRRAGYRYVLDMGWTVFVRKEPGGWNTTEATRGVTVCPALTRYRTRSECVAAANERIVKELKKRGLTTDECLNRRCKVPPPDWSDALLA